MRQLISVLLLCCSAMSAQAALLVLPEYVVFDHRSRVQEVMVANTSDSPKRYDLEFVEQVQTPNGGYRSPTEEELAGLARASDFIRFSPRRVTLQPNESQKVKLLLRRNRNMDQLEYRSHLKFTAVPLNSSADDEATDGVAFKLNLLLSYTIPVVVRTAEKPENVQVTLTEPQLVTNANGRRAVRVTLQKAESITVAGDLVVSGIKTDGEPQEVGRLNSVRTFAESSKVSTEISLFEGVNLDDFEQLVIDYQGRFDYKNQELATVQMAL